MSPPVLVTRSPRSSRGEYRQPTKVKNATVQLTHELTTKSWRPDARYIRNIILDSFRRRAHIWRVPLTEGVSGDEPESERDAASCVHGS
jgi:hypothetical protein